MVIIPEIIAEDCLKQGITPTRFKKLFISTLEEGLNMCSFLMNEEILKYSKDIVLFVSSRTHQSTKEFGKKHFKKVIEIDREIPNDTSNVGLFMICNAIEDSSIENIVMIGMDHATNEMAMPNIPKDSPAFKMAFTSILNPYTREEIFMNPIQDSWRKQFNFYREKYYPEITFVNCTGSGSLFGPGILWEDFENWTIKQ